MKAKLIKLSESHYVIVDDSDIKEDDWVYHIGRKIFFQFEQNPGYKKEFDSLKKITHSFGEGLEGVMNIPLSEVEEVINGYSVEKMANNWFYNEENKNHYENYNEKPAWIKGFNTHKELVKDKVFTVEDIQKAVKMSQEESWDEGGYLGLTYEPEEIIQSLLPKTEWDVTFDENGKLKIKE